MGFKKLDIVFYNASGSYHVPGSIITGHVEFERSSNMKAITGVFVEFQGEASTNWCMKKFDEDSDGKCTKRSIICRGSENYFSSKVCLMCTQDGTHFMLEADKYKYPFSCVLPQNLPSSYEGKFGYVRYTVKASIETKKKKIYDTIQIFSVQSPVDLNQNPKIVKPIKCVMESYFRWCCWKSGILSVVLSLPRTGFIPGEVIPMLVEVENESNVRANNIRIKLYKISRHYSQTPSKFTMDSQEQINKISLGSVPSNSKQVFTETITLPFSQCPSMTNCSIINLNYELRIDVDVTGLKNPASSVPIVIGTVALTNSPSFVPYSTRNCSFDTESTTEWGVSMNETCNILTSPPTYEESQAAAVSLLQDFTENTNNIHHCNNNLPMHCLSIHNTTKK